MDLMIVIATTTFIGILLNIIGLFPVKTLKELEKEVEKIKKSGG
jgi:hypothetical protein